MVEKLHNHTYSAWGTEKQVRARLFNFSLFTLKSAVWAVQAVENTLEPWLRSTDRVRLQLLRKDLQVALQELQILHKEVRDASRTP